MKSEWRIFAVVSTFLFIVSVVYAWWSWAYTQPHHVEWVGVVGLLLASLLCIMCGGYFWFVSTRIDLRPEDRAEAEIADGAGEVGFFSPGSYWPIGIALCSVIAGLGIAYWTVWLIVLGLVFTVVAGAALVFEYYTGARRGAH